MTTVKKSLLPMSAGCVLLVAIVTGREPLFSANAAAAPTATESPLQPADDASRGKALVESSGCFDCHRIADRGSRFGPDLSEIGDLRPPDRLRLALVDPDKEIVPENRFVSFVTKDGAKIMARLLNQDSTSVQVINQKEELRTYLRATLRDYTIVDKELMPSVRGKLTDQQIADIVAYLSSLKGPDQPVK
jgi:putative heme-binding domain-containing protein